MKSVTASWTAIEPQARRYTFERSAWLGFVVERGRVCSHCPKPQRVTLSCVAPASFKPPFVFARCELRQLALPAADRGFRRV
jgi:hypothetical protein